MNRFGGRLIASALALAFPACGASSAPDDKAAPQIDLDARSAQQALAGASLRPVSVTWNGAAGRPKIVSGAFVESALNADQAARAFLREHETLFGLDASEVELTKVSERSGLAGVYVRYQQHIGGLPVFGGQVVVLTRPEAQGFEVRAVNLAQRRPRSRWVKPSSDVGPSAALAAARNALHVDASALLSQTAEQGIAPELGFRSVYRVRIGERAGDWEAFVDSVSGQVLSSRDLRQYATGSGSVFDPNPIATTGDTSLVDNGDADSAALGAARFSVSLPRLDGSGYLRGSFADAHPKAASQRAQSAGLTFDFTRSDDHFEEVMAYFHLDRAQNRIQSSLGFSDVDNRQQVAIPNGTPDDNSFYSPLRLDITFGSGGVDDAEDADVIVHEYGHSIQDNQVPGFGGGDEGAMGEGFGDYLAASFNETLSQEQTSPLCLAEWDSTSFDLAVPGCLRRLDSTKHYPEFADGEVHDDGEMWSSAAFSARTSLGANVMDRLLIESHFLLSNNETFSDAVDALLTSDQNLSSGTHQTVLRRTFVWQGLSRILSTPAN
ncbi:MAG TPA: M36 family metallopeptidase, partial [Polyangiaceae bacterium]|nr:M36 family metallopeptidase [Polyangiaceae bacterium]